MAELAFAPDGVFGRPQAGANDGKSDSSAGISSQIPKCPDCRSKTKKVFRAGLRYKKDGSGIQRWLCTRCGLRFSEKPLQKSSKRSLNTSSALPSARRICALGAKNLDSASIIKIGVGDDEKLPQETRGLLAKYMAYLEREGYYKETSYYDLVGSIAGDGANLLDPEDVKTKIAQHKYKFKNGKEGKWKESTKLLAVQAYDAFCTMEGLKWTKPKYKVQETLLSISDEKDLDALISCASKRMAAFLQCLKETFADPGEALAITRKEIKGNIVQIAHPCKGHYPGEYEVSSRLISMLNNLPKSYKDDRVFPTTYVVMYQCLVALRKKAARKLQNPALLDINFKSFRHWGGSMLAHYTNGNVLTVKKMLRHKSILNTMKYIHVVQKLKDEDFEEAVAITPEEVRQLGKAGWTKYDEMAINGTQMHFYRKPKRFGGS